MSVRVVRRTLLALLIVVGLLIGIDRLAVFAATRYAQNNARKQGAATATIHIYGFPFLTQAIGGSLTHVTVHETNVSTGDLHFDTLDASAHGIRLGLHDVLTGSVDTVPIDRVTGSGVISYATLSSSITKDAGLGQDITLEIKAKDSNELDVTAKGPLGLHVSSSVPVPAVSGGRLQLGAFVKSFASILPDSVANALTLPLPRLPYGLTLGQATAEPDGLHFQVSGTSVTVK